jgi:hypothetical protein
MTFLGLPPFFPLARAASAFAGVVAFPPFLPSAAACGFLATACRHYALSSVAEDDERETRDFVAVLFQWADQVIGGHCEDCRAVQCGGAQCMSGQVRRGSGVEFVNHKERINPSDWVVNNKMRAA